MDKNLSPEAQARATALLAKVDAEMMQGMQRERDELGELPAVHDHTKGEYMADVDPAEADHFLAVKHERADEAPPPPPADAHEEPKRGRARDRGPRGARALHPDSWAAKEAARLAAEGADEGAAY
ncbi:MAG TPA: hypothetical protein VGM56_06000, partial [Byssovorax sp.]